MRKTIIHAIAAVVIIAACALSAVGGRQTASSPNPAPTYAESHFKGLGAITLGCSLWDTPWLDTSEEAQALPRRFILLWMAPDPSGELTIHLSVKHPRGAVTIDGEQCGQSVNWAAFGTPQE